MTPAQSAPPTTLPERARFLEGRPFFTGVLLTGIVLPIVVVVAALLLADLPQLVLIELILGICTGVLLLGAVVLFDEDDPLHFIHRSIWLGYLVKYISVYYALNALLLTVTFAMQIQDGSAPFSIKGAEFLSMNAVVLASVIWMWLIAAASFLAGDARIRMIRRERETMA